MNRLRKNIGKISIYSSLKKIKYLGINLTKEVKHLYNENYKPLKRKKLKNTSEYRKISHAHGLAESKL
jgi:hypothetical protein